MVVLPDLAPLITNTGDCTFRLERVEVKRM